ncbi:hypothetical protein BX285_2572 [Streptomyces sp. 1114.5]|uniref:hypothetical protein n=1 Tax=Streptomyces sp. 1114.5 TaxID=1938830 RepID=UPI000EB01EFC|nr:hypothetical protein [Streptomyces sp. 1114.5]RKT18155.1 hypothetical protein BX285_2572 [Streptomyces sp. 1114.5]
MTTLDSTTTSGEQIGAAGALVAILTAHADLPAPRFDLRETHVPDSGTTWGLRATLHDDLNGFEQWRAALDLDPAAVELKHNDGSVLAWLIVTGTVFGAPVELVGFYNLPEPATAWA